MKHSKLFTFLVVLIAVSMLLTGCGTGASGAEAKLVAQQQTQYANAQPVPMFTWSLERHEMIEIYKARNNAVSTYAVVYNQYKGVIEFQCPSVGYPIPGGTELTNSMAFPVQGDGTLYYSGGTLPQAEPNGLFSPGTSAGTWVMCRSDDGSAYPVYIEDNVLMFPFMMATNAAGTLVKANEADQPTIKIDVTNPLP